MFQGKVQSEASSAASNSSATSNDVAVLMKHDQNSRLGHITPMDDVNVQMGSLAKHAQIMSLDDLAARVLEFVLLMWALLMLGLAMEANSLVDIGLSQTLLLL